MVHSLMMMLALAGQCYDTPQGRVCPARAFAQPILPTVQVPTYYSPAPTPIVPYDPQRWYYPSYSTPYTYPTSGRWMWDGYRWNFSTTR